MVTKKTVLSDTDAPTSDQTTPCTKTCSSSSSILTNVLLIILVILSIFELFFLTGNSIPTGTSSSTATGDTVSVPDPLGIKRALLEVEYDKVGGKENYDIISRVQKLSLESPDNPQNIEAMKNYITQLEGSTGGSTTTTTPSSTLPSEKISEILSNAVIEGNPNADVIAIEYSDLECPYCIRQHNETALKSNLLSKYGDQVAFVFKNNRGVNHSGTETKALGLLCARDLGGNDAYVKFYSAVLSGSTTSEVYPVAKLPELVASLGIDAAAWQTCVDAKTDLAEFNAETAQAVALGMSGTPGTLLLNPKTGKYTTINGAYPLANFTAAIDSLLE